VAAVLKTDGLVMVHRTAVRRCR